MQASSGIFEDLDDPRTGNAKQHDLHEILMSTVLINRALALLEVFSLVEPRLPPEKDQKSNADPQPTSA